MSDSPLISVIIPSVKRPHRLWQALESVAAQTYPHVEVIVINDAGLPVGDLVTRYRTTFARPAHYVDLAASRGAGGVRNTGIAIARGTLIALLDDDDRYRPEHLARLAAALQADPTAVLAYDDALISLQNGDAIDAPITATCRFGRPYDAAIFDQDDFIVTSTVLFWQREFLAVGGFDEALAFCEDWDLLLRLRQRGSLCYVPGEIGVDYSYRMGGSDNISRDFGEKRQAALVHLSARYGLPALVPKTFFDVARDLGFAVVPVGDEH